MWCKFCKIQSIFCWVFEFLINLITSLISVIFKSSTDNFFILFICFFSLLINQYYASLGAFPLDTFYHFDLGFRILKGDIPFTDIWMVSGVLVNYMQDRQNGRLMGTHSTGNGRRQSYAHPPMPRMTNTFMSEGKENPKNLLSELKDGIYAVGFSGGQVDITNGKFVFSCTEAYKVKNGAILYPVKGATLIGDGPSAMNKIQGIGNDLSLDPGIGNCGKSGQWVPVGVGQPTVYMKGITVGGSST